MARVLKTLAGNGSRGEKTLWLECVLQSLCVGNLVHHARVLGGELSKEVSMSRRLCPCGWINTTFGGVSYLRSEFLVKEFSTLFSNSLLFCLPPWVMQHNNLADVRSFILVFLGGRTVINKSLFCILYSVSSSLGQQHNIQSAFEPSRTEIGPRLSRCCLNAFVGEAG